METKNQEPHHQSKENMITSAKPPKPEPRSCARGCGNLIEPIYREPIVLFDHIAVFSNIWVFNDLHCPACKEKIKKEEQERRIEFMEEQKREIKREREFNLKKILGIKGYEECTFENFTGKQNNDAFEVCTQFDPAIENLYLWGPAGVGKTHLAISIMREFFTFNGNAIYKKHASLNRVFQGLKSDEYEEKLALYTTTAVLVMDDLGTGKQTEFADQVLYEILDGRIMNYQHGMVITSNLSLSDLAEKFGDDRLTSRIAGNFKIVKCEGEDYRIRKNIPKNRSDNIP